MKKLTHRLFGGPCGLGALGPGPPGPLDKTALSVMLLVHNRLFIISFPAVDAYIRHGETEVGQLFTASPVIFRLALHHVPCSLFCCVYVSVVLLFPHCFHF